MFGLVFFFSLLRCDVSFLGFPFACRSDILERCSMQYDSRTVAVNGGTCWSGGTCPPQRAASICAKAASIAIYHHRTWAFRSTTDIRLA
ncbi:hypothetical protein F4821DRAFT_231070 [Hypoxylon rubiginosum]|uniref:Uncharacterized protein n=1 Tax=Hypoxylon rubiginosum TaxID=110542 RepID=A0ACC0D9M7_9PEZI|nr:hypothetical protein F4821DRAFT_231070 [Hypoxylon rubiginosum]